MFRGKFAGGLFGFFLGLKGGRPLLRKLFSQDKIAWVENSYRKYDVWAVGIAGFTPIPYKVFTISAGVFNLDLKRFLLVSLISRSARFFLVGITIAVFGPTIKTFLKDYFNLFSIGFMILLVGGFYCIRIFAKRMHKHHIQENNDAASVEKYSD